MKLHELGFKCDDSKKVLSLKIVAEVFKICTTSLMDVTLLISQQSM
jgi:hypothetical protein